MTARLRYRRCGSGWSQGSLPLWPLPPKCLLAGSGGPRGAGDLVPRRSVSLGCRAPHQLQQEEPPVDTSAWSGPAPPARQHVATTAAADNSRASGRLLRTSDGVAEHLKAPSKGKPGRISCDSACREPVSAAQQQRSRCVPSTGSLRPKFRYRYPIYIVPLDTKFKIGLGCTDGG